MGTRGHVRRKGRVLIFLFLRKPHPGDLIKMSVQHQNEDVEQTIEKEEESFLASFIPRVNAEEGPEDEEEGGAEEAEAEEEEEEEEDEEDLVDPAVEIKEKCAAGHCSSYKARLDECNDRVTSKSNTSETCMEEIMDFYHCMDHCAAKDIFTKVK